MRVAHISATFPPYYAGTGNACFHQARCLAARGHEVAVYTASHPGTPVDPEGVAVHRLEPVVRVGNAPLLPRLACIPRFDVIHLFQPFIFGAELAVLRSVTARTPLVSSFQNELAAPGVKGALFRAYNATASRLALARSARLTVLSLDHARSVPALSRELARRPEAFVPTPNGVDVEAFRPADDAGARASLRLAPEATVAMFCARLDAAHEFKRLDLLLRALAEAESPELHLLVVGGGELEPRFRRLAGELGIGGRVVFAGERRHHELPETYRAADFLVLPSDSVESFGIVVVEAFASGLPVIASALPGVRELVSDGTDGMLVEPGELPSLVRALLAMASLEPDRRRQMGAAGREKAVARYTWERSAEILEGAYLAAREESPAAGT